MDAVKLVEAREAKNWSQETLAGKAGVGVSTVSRAERGIEIEPRLAASIAKAVGLMTPGVLPEAPIIPEASPAAVAPNHERIEIVFDISSSKLQEFIETNAVGRVVESFRQNGIIQHQVIQIRLFVSSIHLDLEVAMDDAARLVEAFGEKELEYLDISDVRILQPRLSARDFLGLGLGFGCVGVLCFLAGLYQPVRVPAGIACIVFGTIGFLYPIGRRLYDRRKK